MTENADSRMAPKTTRALSGMTPEILSSKRGTRSTRSPTPYFKFGLFALLVICLVVLACVDASEARRRGSRKSRRRQESENDITIDEPSARKRKKAGRKNRRILKTSEQARIITEKRYLKSDWCKIRPLKQVVQTKNGCKGNFINYFCYGQCNSFYIPKELSGEEKEQEAFKSCSFCKPFKVERVSVTLTCPGRRRRQSRTIKRMVNRIKECRCIAVPDIDSRTPAPEETVSVSVSSIASQTTTGESRR